MDQNENTKAELLEGEDEAGWIVTYADLVTLLLVFFVLLFSISSLNLERFKRVITSIQVSLGESKPPIGLLDVIEVPQSFDRKMSLEDITGLRAREGELFNEINEFIKQKGLKEDIIARLFKGKVIVRVRGNMFFESGSAQLSNRAKAALDKIAEIVDQYPEYDVKIKGHTDDIPISTEHYASNWELSAIRATTVLRYLVKDGIDPVRLTATGYGELFPLVPNNSDENRATNRRVEFVLERQKNRS